MCQGGIMRWLKAVGTSLRGQRSSSRRYFNTKMEDLDMTGKTVLVAGSTGCIGSAITRFFLKQGAKVIGTSTSEVKFEKLKESVSKDCAARLFGKIVDCSDLSVVQHLLDDAVAEHGTLHHVISAVGSWRPFVNQKKFTDQSYDDFQAIMKSQANCLFVLSKVFLPYLNTVCGSTFTHMTGTFGSMDEVPKRADDIVLLFPASAAQNGISAAIHTQYEKAYVTIHDIRLGLLVRDREGPHDVPNHSTVFSDEMAHFVQHVLCVPFTQLIVLDSRHCFLNKLKEYSKKYNKFDS